MELRTINTFLKVAATQNISRAARILGYSQSAVTVQIRQLEKELGVQLFERIGKKISLTERGMEFTSYANEIVRLMNQALTFANIEGELEGSLRIGGVESVSTAILPEMIYSFHKQYPKVKLLMKSGTVEELMEMARQNEIDLLYTLDCKICKSEWKCATQKKEKIVFVTLYDQKIAETESIPIEELIQKPFILTERGAAYQYELERLLAEAELEIHPILELGNTDTIIKLLKRGMGYSFLPEFTVKKDLEQKKLCQIHTNLPQVVMYSQLFYHQSKWVTPQMQKFAELAVVRSDSEYVLNTQLQKK